MEQLILLNLSKEETRKFISETIQAEFKKLIIPRDDPKDVILLTKKEAANYLGRISQPTLDKLIKQQIVKPILLGSLIRFKKHELEEVIKSNTLKNRRSHGR